MGLDTHAAVKTLTAAGASEDIAVAVVDVAQAAAADHGRELVTRADLHAEIAALEARLAWRLITAGDAIAGIAVAAIVTSTVATLRVLGCDPVGRRYSPGRARKELRGGVR